MEVVLAAVICLLLSGVVRLLAFSHCMSKGGYANLDSQCQVYCADGRCPNFCKCVAGNVTETCAKLDFGSNNSLAINETVRPGTPIFTIQIAGKERWSYTLGRGGPVDGSVWSSLSKYLKLTKIGNRYEMIVDVTPDLEDIFQQYGIKLASLTLILACDRDGFPRKDSQVLLQIVPVNEYAPEFFVVPLKTTVRENTKVGSEVYLLSDHTLDLDVNPATRELSSFAMWKHQVDSKTDGRAYFEMADTQKGSIQVKAELDFELLQSLDAIRLYLNVSASDVHGVTSFTTLTVDIQDVDDLPPGFYDRSCAVPRKSCVVSYQVRVPVRFQGEIINIIPESIQARDMDGLNTPVTYSLRPAEKETVENLNKFYINETTGSLFLQSPFEEKGEVDLVIEAREISPMARASQIPLHVTVDGFGDARDFQKLDSSYSPDSNDTNASPQPSVDLFMVATVVQSALVMILLITSLILCAKLKTISRRAPVAQLPEAPDKSGGVPSHHLSKDIGRQSPSTFAVPASPALSLDGVTEGRNCVESTNMGLFNDRSEQNAISELPSTIPFAPSTYKNWIRNNPHERNMQISASPVSSMEIERTISLTVSEPPITRGHIGALALSDCPNTRYGHCGRVAYPNYANAMRRNILAVSNSSYAGKLLILSDPTLNSDSYRGSTVGCNPQIRFENTTTCVATGYNPRMLYENTTTCVATHHLSRSETESTSSDKVRTIANRNAAPQASSIRMPHWEKSSVEDVNKKYDNTTRESESSRKRLPLSSIQNENNIRESSDDCRPTDKESDDGYKNGNSMSDDNTGSCSERMSITPKQSYRDVSSPMAVSVRSKGDSRGTQSSLTSQQNHNTPLPQVETTAIVAGVLQEEGLIKTGAGFDNEKELQADANSPNTNEKDKTTQCCLEKVTQSQSIAISCHSQTLKKDSQTLKNTTESIEPHSRIVTPTPSLSVKETTATNKIQPNTRNETKQSEIVKDVRSVIVSRPLVSPASSNKSKSKYPSREANSTEQSSEIVATSNSFPCEIFAASKSRPHTSDATICKNKSVSSTVIPRASSSAPSRRKRRTKRRTELAEVSFPRTDRTNQYIPGRAAEISHSSCEPQQLLAYDAGPLNIDFQQHHPLPLSNLTHQHQPELLQVENHECLLPYDHANYWPPAYQQVYVSGLHREQPYILLRHQEPPQCNHRMQQHQRLPTVPEVLNLHLHHPDDRVVTRRDGDNECADGDKSGRSGKKDRNKKRLEDPE